jgi:hypothetical protein
MVSPRTLAMKSVAVLEKPGKITGVTRDPSARNKLNRRQPASFWNLMKL